MKTLLLLPLSLVAFAFAGCQTHSASTPLSRTRVRAGTTFDANTHALECLPQESLTDALAEYQLVPYWDGKNIIIKWPAGNFIHSGKSYQP